MAKEKKGLSLNGNTGSLIKVGVIVAAIAVAWGNMTSNVTSVGKTVTDHLVKSDKERCDLEAEQRVLDKLVDVNCVAIAVMDIRQANFDKAQDELIDEVDELRNSQQTTIANTQLILDELKKRREP